MESIKKADSTLRIPSLENEPELLPHLLWVWDAFGVLNYRRGVSMSGPVPITVSDIEAYCRFRYITSSYERDRFLMYLNALDQEWMTNHYKDAKQKTDKTPEPPPNPRPTFTRPRQ